jgi:DNA modification methylase
MIYYGDAREVLCKLADEGRQVQCIVCSPPYFGLRSYLPDDHPQKHLEIGNEPHPYEYVANLVEVFYQARRLLRPDGTAFINLGTSYAGSGGPGSQYASNSPYAKKFKNANRKVTGFPDKNMIPIPWMVGIALQQDGWILRNEIIWAKKNYRTENVLDRFTRAHETILFLSKNHHYYTDMEAVREHGRNKIDVWLAAPVRDSKGKTSYSEELIAPCILAGSRPGDVILDPFAGNFTTCRLAEKLGRQAIGIDLNDESQEK